ncbi:MAG TPA: cupin domain-containing protein [Trichormus sp. M33_DOE_039]|nr:cupin domain-containing protein [Trichormus sp. M33_DOE_039]
MKSALFGLIGSLVLTLTVGSTAKAASMKDMSEVRPLPAELMEYIEQAEAGTLPDPLTLGKETLWVAGGRNTFLETVADNGGKYSVFDLYVPPNVGPPLHFHNREDEWFYVVEGNPSFQHQDHTFVADPGTLLFSPQLERHAFLNKTKDPVRMLLFYALPPGSDSTFAGNIEEFFREVGQEVTDPYTPPPFNPAELLIAGPKYGLTFPSTFVFTTPEFTGNEVSILRTGVVDAAARVILSLGNGIEIPVEFGVGEFLQNVSIPTNLGNQPLNLTLKDPSEGSYLGLLQNQAVLITTSVPESSSTVGLLAFGVLGVALLLKKKQSRFGHISQLQLKTAKINASQI